MKEAYINKGKVIEPCSKTFPKDMKVLRKSKNCHLKVEFYDILLHAFLTLLH